MNQLIAHWGRKSLHMAPVKKIEKHAFLLIPPVQHSKVASGLLSCPVYKYSLLQREIQVWLFSYFQCSCWLSPSAYFLIVSLSRVTVSCAHPVQAPLLRPHWEHPLGWAISLGAGRWWTPAPPHHVVQREGRKMGRTGKRMEEERKWMGRGRRGKGRKESKVSIWFLREQ